MAEVVALLHTPETEWLYLWVDGIVSQEEDEEKVWDVCGSCLLHAVEALKKDLLDFWHQWPVSN